MVLRVLDQMARDVAIQERRAPLCFSAAAGIEVQDYAWPGNLGEMNHVVRGLSASFDPPVTIGARDLQLKAGSVGPPPPVAEPQPTRPWLVTSGTGDRR